MHDELLFTTDYLSYSLAKDYLSYSFAETFRKKRRPPAHNLADCILT